MAPCCQDENNPALSNSADAGKPEAEPLKPCLPNLRPLAPSTAQLQMRYMESTRQQTERPRAVSQSSTPRRCRSTCSDNSDMDLDSSVGEEDSTRRRGRSRNSKVRDLTVPTGPTLHTAWRTRSSSLERTAGEANSHPSTWAGSLRDGLVFQGSRSKSRASSRQGSAAPSPARSTRSTRSARSRVPQLEAPAFSATPSRSLSRNRLSSTITPSPGKNKWSCSDMSLASVGHSVGSSRTSGNSTRSCLSSADLQELEMEEGRRQLAEMLRRNARTYKQAINFPDMRRGHHSLELTMPEEFNLSVSNRTVMTQKPREVPPDQRAWSKSLRSEKSPGRAAFNPTLTVPSAPNLRTSSRHRSSSASSRGCGERDRSMKRSMSCKSMTPREQEAVQRHLERLSASRETTAAELQMGSMSRQLGEEEERWILTARTAEERAERARAAVNKKREEAWNEEKQRLPFRAKKAVPGA
eukprot:TRINITY_DN2084_c0_g1_i3.p1 TRINITY_DN2084_c0_g1~~TRINITY_DN2084_c0_g1_i3.p1  ORF type:complete len:468 (+),score=58.83 TRINITY_DN2084_c0_g1_i3:68-1471(+)